MNKQTHVEKIGQMIYKIFSSTDELCYTIVATIFRGCHSHPGPETWQSSEMLRGEGDLVSVQFSSVQFSSVAQSCPTLCDPMNCSKPGLPTHHQLLEFKFTQTHVHRVGDTIQPSHPLLSPSPSAPNPSSIRVFSNESALRIRWPKYWSFSFNTSPSNEHPGLISFRMDWSLAVQGTLKSLLQYHSSKASILRYSVFFIVQLSHPYRTTGKSIALSR